MTATHASRRRLRFTRQDLADLPSAFPPCVLRNGKIVRADGLPLESDQYDVLDEGFPAIPDGRRRTANVTAASPAHEEKSSKSIHFAETLFSLSTTGEDLLGPRAADPSLPAHGDVGCHVFQEPEGRME